MSIAYCGRWNLWESSDLLSEEKTWNQIVQSGIDRRNDRCWIYNFFMHRDKQFGIFFVAGDQIDRQ